MTTKKITKKSKRRLFLISLVTIGLIMLSLINMFSVWGQMLEISKERQVYSEKLSVLEDEEDALELESEKLQDPDYIAKYAREQYLYSKDGEFNIKITNSE